MNKQENSIALRTFVNGCLSALGDARLQQEVWGEGRWEKWVTYDEAYMNFCSWCKPILEDPLEYSLTSEQTAGLQELYDSIKIFDEKLIESPSAEDHKCMLSNPEWIQIQEQARKVKNLF